MKKFLSKTAPFLFALLISYFFPIGQKICGALNEPTPFCSVDVDLALTGILIVVLTILFYLIKSRIAKIKSKPKDKSAKLNNVIIIVVIIFFGIFTWYILQQIVESQLEPDILKPVIYLYPKEEINVSVSLKINGELAYSYPNYDNGWNVKAYPDGRIVNNGKEYSYLFWESSSNYDFDIKEGFVVKGEDTVKFLEEKLSYLGLTPKEYNEFIVFWYPKMYNNKYNLIYFAKDDYTDNAILEINPKPDSILRVFMVYKPLNKNIYIKEQQLTKFEKIGFSVIEWGGTEI